MKRAYHEFIMGRRRHSWVVAAYAPVIAVRGYLAVWRLMRGSAGAHHQARSNARARFLLAWNGTPTCGLPMRSVKP